MSHTIVRDAEYFEQLYQTHGDPWGYRHAGEQGKYRIMLDVARRLCPAPTHVLEVGCSLGYMTEMLASYAPHVSAFDISATAVHRTRARCAAVHAQTRFDIRLGNALEPGYAHSQFDVVFAGDVLHGAFNGTSDARRALQALLPLLVPGGVLIVSDYINPAAQHEYVHLVETSGGSITERLYFDDRYWFRLRGSLKGLRSTGVGERLLRSESVYRWLSRRSAARGPEGSKHFGLVVQNQR